MASLNEIRAIYRNATQYVDELNPTQDEIDAHALLDRCEAHLWRRANDLFSADDISDDLRFLKLANRITVDSREIARRMLVILLGSDAAESATVAQILGTNDAAVAAAINAIAGRFALALVQPNAR